MREFQKLILYFFLIKSVHPGDLKNAVTTYVNDLLEPVRKEFETEEMQKLILNAYPPPAPVQKKIKKGKKAPRCFHMKLNSLTMRQKTIL